MKIVVQRVTSASVKVENHLVSAINKGFLLLVGIQKGDTHQDVLWCAKKVNGLRIFDDSQGKMNLDIKQVQGEILSVSQFTLGAEVIKGNRPSFSECEVPEKAKELFEAFNQQLIQLGNSVQTGIFQAMMEVSLVNDGPVTIIIESRNRNGQ